jgi:hypothetical protein
VPILTSVVQSDGPKVDIELAWSKSSMRAARLAGRPIPPPVRVEALIDTGADTTCLAPAIAEQLGLAFGGLKLTNFPVLGGLEFAIQHDASVRILFGAQESSDDLVFTDLLVLELELGLVGYQALLGRDVLDHCDFLYEGPARRFQLTY